MEPRLQMELKLRCQDKGSAGAGAEVVRVMRGLRKLLVLGFRTVVTVAAAIAVVIAVWMEAIAIARLVAVSSAEIAMAMTMTKTRTTVSVGWKDSFL
jgi:hypothetical protein